MSKFSNKFLPEIIMDSMPGMCFIFASDGKMIAWNKRVEEVLGY